ncbi:hypothetical protein [Macrococcoides canis]|uniref:Uncharacterized protein n=1 Tax=Macrococcoides canis TaxID=1855823 RepID=A0A4R6C761_9STAP|nr:hypothetical protein [Macrococcus canis]MEE1107742.1 hypothetical protein [Macrococcus canis]TDM18171.1 hypothetical protein ETI04_01375 [Macrococcus canis]TDM21776.1 hypothetical protein ETI05_03280 [Macrococcus canis]TDM24274.1 hypothetical protein ETI02_00330 [Macrococcus canis]TDM32768.1 hypothetical protein ETI03_03440 [Macrococcus canis]
MTIRISKEFMLYFILFLIITLFSVLYIEQSQAIYYNEAPGFTEQIGEQNRDKLPHSDSYHDPVSNGEVLGVVN